MGECLETDPTRLRTCERCGHLTCIAHQIRTGGGVVLCEHCPVEEIDQASSDLASSHRGGGVSARLDEPHDPFFDEEEDQAAEATPLTVTRQPGLGSY